MTIPWQTAAMQIRYGDTSYLPLEQIVPPPDGSCPEETPDKLRPLWLGLHLVRGVPLPPDMAGEHLTARFHAAGAWLEVPLVVAGQNGSAAIVPVLLGRLSQPEIDIIDAASWLTSQAAGAARAALRLVGQDTHGFLLLPRFMPGSLPLIDGHSLGLPLAVAALRLCADKHLPADIIMTGQIDGQGNVLPVGHLPEKRACARSGFYPARLFLYPADNQIDAESLPESLPIRRLEDADALLDLAATVDVAEIAWRLPLWRNSPAEFFSWLNSNDLTDTVQMPLLELARRQNWCIDCTDAACSAALEVLKRLLKNGKSNVLPDLLTTLFPHDRIRNLPASSALLTLAEKCKTQANHGGVRSEHWDSLIERCLTELQKNASHSVSLAALTSEIRIKIGDRHNAFCFRISDISQDWLKQVNRFAELGSDPNIGKCYGFLTQHYAFCGMYDEAFACAERSLENFREPKDRRRRYIDRVYLFLDSNRIDEARRELLKVAGADAAGLPLAVQVASQTDAYVHAAFARLCQHLPHEAEGYPVAELLEGTAGKHHPWQLWACNLGRLLAQEQPELARRCLTFSRDICLADPDSITLPPMTLMPLAVLYTARLAPQTEVLHQTEELLRRIACHCADGMLYEPHFRPLLHLPTPAAVLEEVAANTGRYFPFNYC